MLKAIISQYLAKQWPRPEAPGDYMFGSKGYAQLIRVK